jgi:diacylglycerol kinase family enzyme
VVAVVVARAARHPVTRVRSLQVADITASSSQAMALAIDGEVAGELPARCEVAAGALRVVTPQ